MQEFEYGQDTIFLLVIVTSFSCLEHTAGGFDGRIRSDESDGEIEGIGLWIEQRHRRGKGEAVVG